MRRLALFVLAGMALVLAACEDGPDQTYSPAPANAGNIWNGPQGTGGLVDGGAVVPPATAGFDASFGGQNANDICTATQEKTIWTGLFSEPIQVPGLAGGIDIAGGPNGDGSSGYVAGQPFTYDATKETWTGTTVEQAEKILCQGVADQIYYGETNFVGWGESLELSAQYNTSSRQITDLDFTYGYVGTLNATSADGKTKYVVSLNNVPMTATTASGTVQLLLNWTDPSTFNPIVNGLYDALRSTYQPTFPADTDCIAAGHCVIGNNLGQGGYLFFTSLNLALFVNTTVGSAQANSIIGLVDLGLLKLLPFSLSSNLLKLDTAGEGPTSITTNAGGAEAIPNTTCKYVLGMTFADFDSHCVDVFPSGNPQNTIAKNKLFGAMSHGDEAYHFDINGVDPQFTATLASTAVVGDTQRPSASDVAYELTLDQFEIGKIANDYTNNDTTMPEDLHGIGMLTLEWANMVQQYMTANYGVNTTLGDPECIKNPAAPVSVVAVGDAGADAGAAPKVCSGLEGIVTTAPAALVPPQMAVNALGVAALSAGTYPNSPPAGSALAVGLKPGTWYSLFCSDGGGLDATGKPIGYANCIGPEFGFNQNTAYYFDTMADAVALSFGTKPIPSVLASRRFYFQEWMLALIKYLQSAANPAATLAEIDANVVDPNNLFFDSQGAGFDGATYVYRNAVNSAQQPPTAVEVTTNLTTSVINNYTFSRYNFRGETALYSALQTVPTDKLGAEPLFLSNIVGSPVLVSTYGSYACAINQDPTNMACGGIVTPLDPATSKPLYTGYAPAFGQSVLNIAANGAPPSASAMTVQTTNYELIQSAMVTLPIWTNPYDPTTATAKAPTISVLLPFTPKGANVGFPVTIDGSRDKFYNTNETDFTGTTVNGVVDWEYVPTGALQNELVVRAFESQNYLGLVFVCAQPGPTGTDILAVHMYQSGQDILNWIQAHPGATSACNFQIKYSIYGNYPDFITSLQNGIRIGLNATYGGAVVTDMTIFDPNVVAALGQ